MASLPGFEPGTYCFPPVLAIRRQLYYPDYTTGSFNKFYEMIVLSNQLRYLLLLFIFFDFSIIFPFLLAYLLESPVLEGGDEKKKNNTSLSIQPVCKYDVFVYVFWCHLENQELYETKRKRWM